MNILAIDLGTTTGWALSQAEGIISGSVGFAAAKSNVRSSDKSTKSTKSINSVNSGIRFLNFRNWLISMFSKYQIDTVAFEMVHNHKGVYAAHIYGGFLATLETVCFEQQAPIVPFGVKVIKKFIAGNGNASKQDMIDAVVSLGFKPIDDNEADSIGILLLALDAYKSETVLDATNTSNEFNTSTHCCVIDTKDVLVNNLSKESNDSMNSIYKDKYTNNKYMNRSTSQPSKDSCSEIKDTV